MLLQKFHADILSLVLIFTWSLCVPVHAWYKIQKATSIKASIVLLMILVLLLLLAISRCVWVKLLVQCYTFSAILSRASGEFLVYTGFIFILSLSCPEVTHVFPHCAKSKKNLLHTIQTHGQWRVALVPTHIRSHLVWAIVRASKRKTPICCCCCCSSYIFHYKLNANVSVRFGPSFIRPIAR